MKTDEIIEMAREVGFDTSKENRIIVLHSNGSWVSIKFELEAFAKLVAAKEREACAKECDKKSVPQKGKLRNDAQWVAMNLATAIRARGEA